MSVRNGIVLLVALSTLLFLAACGGNGTSIATPVAPPSGAFSNSNLNGTYVFSISGTDANDAPYAIAGTLTANGSGGNGKGSITAALSTSMTRLFSSPAAGVSITSGSTYSVMQMDADKPWSQPISQWHPRQHFPSSPLISSSLMVLTV